MTTDTWTAWAAFVLLLALNLALLACIVLVDRRRRKWRELFLHLDAMTPDQFKSRWNRKEARRLIAESLIKSSRRLAKAFEDRRPIPEGGETVRIRRPVPFEQHNSDG